MSEFTAGPYVVSDDTDPPTIAARNEPAGRQLIAQLFRPYTSAAAKRADDERMWATARLIAAAPELYEALEAALQWAVEMHNMALDTGAPAVAELWAPRVSRLRRALAKARGEDDDA